MTGFAFGESISLMWKILWASLALTGLLIAVFALVRHPVRWLVFSFRILTWIFLLAALFRLSIVHYEIETERKPLAIVVDRSESMALPIEGKKTRWGEVQHFLSDPSFWPLAEKKFDLRFFTLAERLSPTSRDSIQTISAPSGDSTHLHDAIRHLGEEASWGGVLWITDGVDTSKDLFPDDWKSNVPMVALYPSGPKEMIDAAIVAIRSPEVGYFKSATHVEVDVEGEGVSLESIHVRLFSGDRLLAETAQPSEGWHDGKATFSLTFAPDRLGPMGLRAEIQRFPDELTYDNNQRLAVIQVMRDRIRVLHVSGKPTWDERFLRAYLKENPNVDLVSFYILRSPSNDPEAPENSLSLIPFPYHELFTKELENFDLVVFQNFDFRTYFPEFYLANIQSYVEKGGAFFMIGGDLTFGRGNYRETAIESILPVRLRDDTEEVSTLPFSPRMSSAGSRHPILARTWSNEGLKLLPSFWGFHRTAGLQDHSVSLLEHPTERMGNLPMPILAIRMVGEGRTSALMVDSLWRWNFGERSVAYRELLNRIYRWLTRDPSFNPLQMELPREARVADSVPVRIRLFDERYSPLANAKVKLNLIQGTVAHDLPDFPATNNAGESSLSIESRAAGFLELEALVPGKEEGGYRARGITLITPKNQEWVRRGIDIPFLSRITESTGGAVHPILSANISSLDPITRNLKIRKVGKIETPIWDRPWVLICILFFACFEWFIRRRFGGA